MCGHAHHEREAQSPLRPGEAAVGGFVALSCYLSLTFKHSDTKWGGKHSRSNIRGGGAPVAPPSLNSPLEIVQRKFH